MYVLELETSKNITQNSSITQMPPSPDPPTQDLSSSRVNPTVHGLREYIEVSNQCEFVRKRIKILERIQDHNEAKVRVYKNSLDKFKETQIQKEQAQLMKREFLVKKNMSQAELKDQNRRNRDERRNKIVQVLKEIEEEKVQDRNKIRQQSQNIAQKIQQNKQRDLLQKREKRNRVLQLQQQSKQNYRNYFLQKKDYLSKKNQAQLNQLEQLKKEKNNEIKQMNKIQISIMEKQSEVKYQFNTVRGRLAEIYGVENKNSISMHANALEDKNKNRNSQNSKVSKHTNRISNC